ncbi:hypothetical protein MYX76_00940 [Desulfobacterota bacterium AH_259_B03_O07]|nr:hypothetical protein [Desulfobacterota bacterium AH_259_B03_O07]
MNRNYPNDLKIKNRKKLPTTEFMDNEKLFRAFDERDLDETDKIKLETVRFPDFSCDWSRFSKPGHIRYRINGSMTDGCYSFTVLTSRYKEIATPVHDPISDDKFPNYAHVEVRELSEGESIYFEPPKNRKRRTGSSKQRRLEYRQNMVNNLFIDLNPSEQL